MKKLAVTSLAALTLSLAAASGAQAVEALPVVKVAPPGATSAQLPCSSHESAYAAWSAVNARRWVAIRLGTHPP